jgi:hypothetical protein
LPYLWLHPMLDGHAATRLALRGPPSSNGVAGAQTADKRHR